MRGWVAQEVRGCEFPDQRLTRRLRTLVNQLADSLGRTIPMACQDWAATKAAYRFFSNDRVNESLILKGHFEATAARCATTEGPILVLQDTTEFSYKREDGSAIGFTNVVSVGAGGRSGKHTVCGLLMHSSLAVTTDGLPLGLASIKFWTRKKFKGTNSLKKKINPTRVPIESKESIRWIENLRQSTELLGNSRRLVHIGDRESDIFELFCAAEETGSHFLVRTCVDRLAGDGSTTLSKEMKDVRVRGLHRVEVRDHRGRPSQATLELRYRRVVVHPPVAKKRSHSPRTLTLLHATERGDVEGRQRIEWKLLTDLPIRTRQDAVEKLEWYAQRWKIETYHKVLKSGCKAEALRLQTAERLTNALAVFCILAWRVMWITMLNRDAPEGRASLVFTELELRLLDKLVPTPKRTRGAASLSTYVTKLARLGGFLARARDGPPGNAVIWRGLAKLTDIEIGYTLDAEDVGKK